MDMHIRLCSFGDVRPLADLATALPFRVWTGDGRQWVDARSLMCIFGLDLREPLSLRCGRGGEAFEDLRALLGELGIE